MHDEKNDPLQFLGAGLRGIRSRWSLAYSGS